MTEAWVSLIQTGIWLVAIGAFLFFTRKHLREIADALIQRIVAGAPVGIGPVNLGAVPDALRIDQEGSATAEGVRGAELQGDTAAALEGRAYPDGLIEELYLIHSSEVIRPRSAGAPALFRIRLWVEGYTEPLLDGVTRVTYRLHDTFPRRVISTTARDQEFQLWMNVYGEFTVVAYVEREVGSPIWLTRYLDLPGRPPD